MTYLCAGRVDGHHLSFKNLALRIQAHNRSFSQHYFPRFHGLVVLLICLFVSSSERPAALRILKTEQISEVKKLLDQPYETLDTLRYLDDLSTVCLTGNAHFQA
jgi:hypothetical protein